MATLLGAAHAFAPGHGKTVLAACLLSRQGSARQALALGGTIAASHTVGVLALGMAVTAAGALAPERLYPWLGAAAGLLFAAAGVVLLRAAWRQRRHHRAHAHGDHAHGDHVHAPGLSWRTLVAPGLAGGLVPSPSALVVLLGGLALGRGLFGTLLVAAYGVGMAATLVGGGYLLVALRSRLAGPALRWPALRRATAILPLVTAWLVVLGGLAVAARAVAAV